MTIDFHDAAHRHTYAGRDAHDGWKRWMAGHWAAEGKRAADIGCGGGIYSRALAELGAAEVVGVDFSKEMLAAASSQSSGYGQIRFRHGSASDTGLDEGSFDLVLERALIHHIPLSDLTQVFREAYRVLAAGGTIIVQDRTPDDCLLPGSPEHIRGYFFEKYPQLNGAETSRRHTDRQVRAALEEAGFSDIRAESLWETRKRYSGKEELRADLAARTGRSLLHELSDEELAQLCDYVELKAGWTEREAIEEKDRWTVWLAGKPGV